MFNPNLLYMPGRSILPIARKTINWAGLLSNTQKTLNIVNLVFAPYLFLQRSNNVSF